MIGIAKFHPFYAYYSGFPTESPSLKMRAVLRRQKGGHGPRRSLRKLRKLGMRVQQLVLPCVCSS